jgi:hypothetical protein
MEVTMDSTGLNEKKRGKKSTWYENEDGDVVAKVCKECKIPKVLNDFAKQKSCIGGVRAKCKMCSADDHRNYYMKNSERNKNYMRRWYQDNRAWKSEYNRVYSENNDYYSEYHRNWRISNPDKMSINSHKRRARKRALPANLTLDDQVTIIAYFNEGCALTGIQESIHWDHVIPLSTGYGGTTHKNMIPLRDELNYSKNDANIFEWFATNRDRFGLEQTKFDALIEYLANINEMTIEEYRDYVYYCHDNPRTIEEITELSEAGKRSTENDEDHGNGPVGEVS